MKKQILSILLMAFAAVFAGCNSENKQVKSYSPYVDAVTPNVVPRASKISIEFNREIIDSYADGKSISKYHHSFNRFTVQTGIFNQHIK